mmetsp:Transcript_24403/g.21650  ORF Transcript_24403/g.21650 Transcript_24403/m.21650 type:complete len:87 (+) Transcript_24403:704-964(+)
MFNINGEVILKYIDSLHEYDETMLKHQKNRDQREANLSVKKVQISNKITTVNYDREDKPKNLYLVNEEGEFKRYDRDDSLSSNYKT